MRLRHCLVVALACTFIAAPAQPARWANTYGGASNEWAYSVRPTTDGGYVVAGETLSFGASSFNAWVLKLDAEGHVNWQNRYDGSGSGIGSTQVSAIRTTVDGGYVVAGAVGRLGGTEGWLFKLDGSGNILWQRSYAPSGGNGSFASVEQTADGGLIVGGAAWNASLGRSAWALKLDANGGVVWQRRYSAPMPTLFSSIRPSLDGGYVAAGGYEPPSGTNFWLVKLTADGDISWQKSFGGGNPATTVVPAADGGYLLAGDDVIAGGQLIKVDAGGNVAWARNYGGIFTDAQALAGGDYVVAGSDNLVMRVNGQGDVVWAKAYGGSYAYSVYPSFDGGYVTAGIRYTPDLQSLDYFVLALDANGEIPGCSDMTTPILAESNASPLVVVYPVSVTATNAVPTSTEVVAVASNIAPQNRCYYSAPVVVVTAVPTMSGWVIAALSALLGLAALRAQPWTSRTRADWRTRGTGSPPSPPATRSRSG